MPALYTVQPRASGGGQIAAADINQLVNTLNGNQNTPVNVRTTDPIAYTLQLQNSDAAGKALLIYAPDGTTVLARVQNNGVVASPDGTAAAPIVTTTHTQTLSGKIISGGGGTAAGALGFSGTNLLVGDGTVIENINVGPWGTFTPTLTQGVALTLSTALGRYMQIGKTVIASVEIVINSAGTAASTIVLGGLPVAARAPSIGPVVRGNGWYWHITPDAVYLLVALSSTSTSVSFASGSGGASSGFGVAPAVTTAASDRLMLSFAYEAA